MATITFRFERCLYTIATATAVILIVYNINRHSDTIQTREGDFELAKPHEAEGNNREEPKIECENLISQPLPGVGRYNHRPHTDAHGGDLFPVKSNDVETLKKICDALDMCAGFNTNGWLKKGIGQTYATNIDLYVKEAPLVNSVVYLSSKIIEDYYGKDYIAMTKQLKVYIYDISIGEDIKSPKDYKYGVEQLFIDLLKESPYRTKNPEEADLFFIPMRCTAYRKSIGDYVKAVRFAQEMTSAIIQTIKSSHPYWQRSLGADHFYICAHDIGPSVAAKSDSNLWKNAIALVNTADYEDPYFVPHKDISLPPHPSHGPKSLPELGRGGHDIDPGSRRHFVFFSGTLDRGRIRTAVKVRWSKDPDFHLFEGIMPAERYTTYLKTSKFCLFMRGNRAWSPRLMDALWFGCVPVILSDNYDLPLQGLVTWDSIAVIVPESQLENLKGKLMSVSSGTLTEMQSNIRQVYAHLTWNNPPRPYDAFHSVMYQLWRRRHVVRYRL